MGILEVFVLVVGIVSSYSTLSSKMESKRIWIYVAVIAVFAASQAWAIKCFGGGGGDVGGLSSGTLLLKEETCGEGIFQCKNATTAGLTTFSCGTTTNETIACTNTTVASVVTRTCHCNAGDLCNGSEILKSGNFFLFLMLILTLMMKQLS